MRGKAGGDKGGGELSSALGAPRSGVFADSRDARTRAVGAGGRPGRARQASRGRAGRRRRRTQRGGGGAGIKGTLRGSHSFPCGLRCPSLVVSRSPFSLKLHCHCVQRSARHCGAHAAGLRQRKDRRKGRRRSERCRNGLSLLLSLRPCASASVASFPPLGLLPSSLSLSVRTAPMQQMFRGAIAPGLRWGKGGGGGR